jgi:hypothetical protein
MTEGFDDEILPLPCSSVPDILEGLVTWRTHETEELRTLLLLVGWTQEPYASFNVTKVRWPGAHPTPVTLYLVLSSAGQPVLDILCHHSLLVSGEGTSAEAATTAGATADTTAVTTAASTPSTVRLDKQPPCLHIRSRISVHIATNPGMP